ncbi:MAG: hypothetical protein JRE40_15355, partial [Deltaproteobacteria bacterium]|nr:hypothetical protein [Deltaproteobacteria bacterium]
MIEYHYKNVHIEIAVKEYVYVKNYPNYGERETFTSTVPVNVKFWTYEIKDLTELAFIKSVLQSYIYNRMRSMAVKVFKINLNPTRCLSVTETLKDGERYLKIWCEEDRKILKRESFNYQEVVMLDTALNKAITCLSTNIVTKLTNNEREE